MQSIDDILNGVLVREGGYVCNANDPGGATCYGITEAVARAGGYAGAMQDLPRSVALAIYNHNYVTLPGFDLIYAVSPLIGAELIDAGVNQGVPQASSYLQKALNLFNLQGSSYPDLIVDMRLGPVALNALKSFLRIRGVVGEKVLQKAVVCMQGARYIDIGEHNQKLESFEYGWFAARINFNLQ